MNINDIVSVYLYSVIATIILVGGLAVFAFRQGKLNGARVFFIIALTQLLVAIFETLSMFSATVTQATFWFNLKQCIYVFIPLIWVLFIVEYYGKHNWLSKWSMFVAFTIPVISAVLIWIPNQYLWILENATIVKISGYWLQDVHTRIPGFWFYIQTSTVILELCIGFYIMLRDLVREHQVGRAVTLLLGCSFLASIVPSFFVLFLNSKLSWFNPIIPSIGIKAVIQIVAVFTAGFLRQKNPPSSPPDDKLIDDQAREALNLLVLLFILISALIISTGFFTYRSFALQNRYQVEAQLTSISLLKVAEINKWRNERIEDASIFYQNLTFSNLLQDYLQSPDSSHAESAILEWLNAVARHEDYDKISVYASDGSTIAEDRQPMPTHVKESLPSVYSDGLIQFIDFHRDDDDNTIYLSLLVPVYSTSDQSPLGVVLLRINPEIYFYPMLLRWPVPSDTSETAIVRKDGDHATYISDLRFDPDAALNLEVDLSNENRPIVQAVNGAVGIIRGVNYRNHEVIADVRPIPNTPWYLISRIDEKEASKPVTERRMITIVVFGLLFLLTGGTLLLVWRQQKYQILLNRSKSQAEVSESNRRLSEAQQLARLGFWYWDLHSGNVEWSDEVFKIFQLDPNKFTPNIKSILSLSPWPEDQHRDQELIDRCLTRQAGQYTQKFLKQDYSIGYYSSTFQGLFDQNGNLFAIVGSMMDITERMVQEQALRESENRFRTLFEQAAVGVAIIETKTGRYLDINQKFCDILGYSKEEIIKKTFRSNSLPEYARHITFLNRRLISGKINEYTIETQFIRKNGTLVWANLVASPLWESANPAVNYPQIAVIQDITAQKKAQLALVENEQKFRETITNLDEGYFSTTIDGVILEHNQAYNRILGLAVDRDLRKTSIHRFWQNQQAKSDYFQELMEKGVVNSYQINAQKVSGEKLHVLSSAHLVYDEKRTPIRIDGIFLDITERIKQEEELLTAQAELQRLLTQAEQSRRALLTIIEDQKMAQQEINHLNKTLEERVERRTAQLEASNQELESFAYSISHDLRAPLRAIDGYSRILEKDYAKSLDDEGLRLLNIVRTSTKYMDTLITDLLALSRVGRSELIYEPVDMKAMALSTFEELATPEIREKVKFDVGDLPKCKADPTLIRHVWLNLVSNAIKYSISKPHPEIHISGVDKKESCVYTIRDNGVGFDPEHKDKLFGLFQRLHKSSEYEGTGVGLAIVQRVIQRHEGLVWGDGQLNIGAEFSFTLPKKVRPDDRK